MLQHSLRGILERLECRDAPSVSAVGAELALNSYTTGTQRSPAIAADADGDFVAVWESGGQDGDGFGVFARRYSAGGSPLSAETLVNTFTTGSQSTPSVAMDADGDFVVAWKSLNQDGDGYGIFAQRFSGAGTPRGQEFQVNQYTVSAQENPAIAMDADGNFVIAWESLGQDGNGDGVFARRFDADGIPLGPEFPVNGFTAGTQRMPAVAGATNGEFVVAWQSSGQDGDGYGIYARQYSATGAPLSTEFRVNTFTALGQQSPAVALDVAGDFVVVWSSDTQEGAGFAFGVYGQRYSAAGVPEGGEFHVNTVTSANQSSPSVACAAGGAFVVAYQSDAPGQDGSASGIYLRLYTAAGVAIGGEVRVNTYVTNAQNNAAVACDAEGDFVVTWSGAAAFDSVGVSAQRYDESQDTAPPWIVDLFPSGGADPIMDGERLAVAPSALVVSVSEDFSVTGGAAGPNSITNPANWVLSRNGVAVPMAGIVFGFNSLTRRFEATLLPAAPLTDGMYVLTSQSTLRDVAGNALDGNRDGTPGGEFARAFRVAIPVAVGAEFRPNQTTAGQQYGSSIAIDGSGNFIVTWTNSVQSSYDIYARRYGPRGDPLGGEFRVNTYTSGLQLNPVVAADGNGSFVIAWESIAQDGSDSGIYVQRFTASGTTLGGEFRANANTVGPQSNPALALDAAGNFVIAWDGTGDDPSPYGVSARRFAADGTALGTEFRVNTYTFGAQTSPAIAVDASGNFTIVWQSNNQDGDAFGIYAQRYNSVGTPLGGEFRVNSFTTGSQGEPAIAADSDGDFVIAWHGSGQDGSGFGIVAQRFSSSGAALARPTGALPGLGQSEFRVNSFTFADQAFPHAVMDADGDFVIAWSSFTQDGSGLALSAQRFAADGVPQSGEIPVNSHTTNDQYAAAAASDSDGDFIVTWTSRNQDGDGYGIYAQRFGVSQPRVSGVQVNDGAAQRSRVTSLQVTFSGEVTFATNAASAFTLARNGGGAVSFQATPAIVNGVTVVTLANFSGAETESASLRDGRYTLTVFANQISANSEPMASDFNFGDAEGLFRFYGDMNGDRRVDISDFGFFSLAYLQPMNYNPALDFNNDGRIDIADFGQFSVRYFTSLP